MSAAPLPSLLLVDDSEDDVFLISRFLRRAGIECELEVATGPAPAKTCLEACLKNDRRWPLAVFLDIKMPGDDGLDILAWAMAKGVLDKMFMAVISSSPIPSDQRRALQLGARVFLPKFPDSDRWREVWKNALALQEERNR